MWAVGQMSFSSQTSRLKLLKTCIAASRPKACTIGMHSCAHAHRHLAGASARGTEERGGAAGAEAVGRGTAAARCAGGGSRPAAGCVAHVPAAHGRDPGGSCQRVVRRAVFLRVFVVKALKAALKEGRRVPHGCFVRRAEKQACSRGKWLQRYRAGSLKQNRKLHKCPCITCGLLSQLPYTGPLNPCALQCTPMYVGSSCPDPSISCILSMTSSSKSSCFHGPKK